MSDQNQFTLTVNGKPEIVTCSAGMLSEVLRKIASDGNKKSDVMLVTGACTVLVDGEPVCSCLMTAARADGCHVETVESLSDGDVLSLLQQAFSRHGAAQCGICTPAC